MRKTSRFTAFLLAFFMAVACGGCAASGADRLYALPRLSEEYVQLEGLIAQRIRAGGEYAAPTGGRNRQSVQLQDLDGDGVPEAVAFLADSSHTPNVCVYRQGEDGSYYLFVAIEGAGSAVSSVEYADLNGDGARELIIAWLIGGDIRLLSVYTLNKENQAQLLSADCSEFVVCDLDGNGVDELMDLTVEPGGSSTLVRYVFDANGEASSAGAKLSEGAAEVLRIRSGYLSDGTSALFVESRWGEDELITDVFTAGGGELKNITLGADRRSNTIRSGQAFAADIDADRSMDIPESASDVLNWYSLDASGRRTLTMTTYHSYDGGWYLALPEELLAGGVTVTERNEVSGERAATFTAAGTSGERVPLLTIYTLTGENRMDRAGEEGRFILGQSGTTVFAGELLDDSVVTQEQIEEGFNVIYPEWQTGDL